LCDLRAQKEGQPLSSLRIDLGESTGRACRLGGPGASKYHAISSNTCIYSFGMDRVVLPQEMAFMLGFGSNQVRQRLLNGCESLPPHKVMDLVKNTMCLPSVSAVILSMLLNFPEVFKRREAPG
jgi:hypothetical protein